MAYAAVISLKRTFQRLQNPINKPQITNSAYEELNSLGSILKKLDDESSRNIDRRVVNELDDKIREAVRKLEDVLESYYSLIPPSQGLDEKGVEQEIDSFLKKVKILIEEYNTVLLQNPLSGKEEDDAAVLPLINKSTTVGLWFLKKVKMLREGYNRVLLRHKPEEEEEEEDDDDDEALSAAVPAPVNQLTTVGLSDLSQNIINQLLFEIGLEPERFVSLVGMAGIGKTHLGALIYHHPLIVQHFHVRLWVTAGPKYQAHNIYADILSQIEGKPRDLFKEKGERTLAHLLHKRLHSTRRYLIVLDDIWTTQVLYYITRLDFKDHGNGCRFLITTRLQQEDIYEGATKTIHQMPFLNNEESWNLLWQNVFVAEKSFPPQLEKQGRKIAEKCEGLPLLILAVASILRGLDKTEEYWMKVAENKTTTFTDAYDQIYEVLLPSYEYLPQHLRACFLYMGVFPQTCEIPTSKLINLWAAEDILEPTQQQKLEEFAIECMEDLVSKSLIIVCKWSFRTIRKIKSSKLHSAYWYLCVTEARKNKLFHVLNKLTDVYIERPRRLAVQNNILLGLKEVYDSMAAVTSTTRSLVCTGVDHQYPVRICFSMMLLMRVLDALAIRFYEFPNEILKLLQLRYLSLTHNGELPSSISKLQQLQCLILNRHHNIIKLVERDSSRLPEEIWDMEELRHLWIMESNLPDPSEQAELPKLLRLYVNANSCTKAVFRSIPNLKKLGIKIELLPDTAAESIRCLEHIRVLNTLESVKCVVVNPRLKSQLTVAPPDHLSNMPETLKKLSLNGLGYSWKHMSAVGSLRKLEVLKLRCSAFQGAEWKTKAGQFLSLKYLLLEDIDLVRWTAEDNCFPRLRRLSVRHCYKLKKIPSEMGDIPYMEMMEVDDCSPSVVASVQQIKLKTKYSYVQVAINSSWNLR